MSFDHLRAEAKRRKVSLQRAYAEAGVDRGTYWRHTTGRYTPRTDTEAKILRAISALASQEAAPSEHWSDELRVAYVRLRHRRGLTQGQVEDLIGVTGSLVAKWEARMRRPGAFLLTCWAEGLDARLMLVPSEKLDAVQAVLEG